MVDRHGKVSTGSGVSSGRGVHVFNTRHVQKLLGDQRCNDTRTSGGRNQTNTDGAAFAGYLAGHGVGLANVETPVASADRDEIHLGVDDGTTNSNGDFFATFAAEADVAVSITYGDVALEASALTSRSLLLNGHDFHDFVSKGGSKQSINDLVFLDSN